MKHVLLFIFGIVALCMVPFAFATGALRAVILWYADFVESFIANNF